MEDYELHPITVIGVNQQSEQEAPMLVLEDDLDRQFELSIGLCEALAIQLAVNGTAVGRPLTHDLLLSLADHLDATVDSMVIDDFSNGIYYARLILRTPDGPISLDCRPSDGIAVALRARVPILATDPVIAGEGHEE